MPLTYEEKEERLQNLLVEKGLKHKNKIVLEETLKDAHIYCKINKLSGQSTGPLLEHFIINKLKLKKNKASDCIGDFCKDYINYEYKGSNGGAEHNEFNFVQLRPHHQCDYIFSTYYLSESNVENLGELFIFILKKEEMKEIICKYGGYAHGTIEVLGPVKETLQNKNNKYEYCIRPKYNDKCWNELMKYRIKEEAI